MEILSIFIGITAAFWLDNWNKDRLQKIEEIKILKELRNGLLSTLGDMESNREGHLSSIQASRQLVHFINGELESTDSVNHYHELALIDYTFTPNTGAYETLKSRGVQLISNDSIRLDVISLYDFVFKSMVRMEEEEEAFEYFKSYAPALRQRLSKMKFSYYNNGMIRGFDYPDNYRKQKDKELMLLTDELIHSRSIMMGFYRREGSRVREVISDIESELSRLGATD